MFARKVGRIGNGISFGAPSCMAKPLGCTGSAELARQWRGRGFSMRILFYARHRMSSGIEKEPAAELVDRETLLRESDFLSVHVPLTPETRHSIGKSELARMKPSAFLIIINTARGNILDEEALVQALQAGQLRGAGLDVYENEPRVHPAFVEMTNVVLLPHVGSATAETRLRMAMPAAENLLLAFKGQYPPHWSTRKYWDDGHSCRCERSRLEDDIAFAGWMNSQRT